MVSRSTSGMGSCSGFFSWRLLGTGSEQGLPPSAALTRQACPPLPYSLLQRDPELLVGQRGPWWHGLGGRGRALLCGFEEVVIPWGGRWEGQAANLTL